MSGTDMQRHEVPWVEYRARAALEDKRSLTLEERGVYVTLIDLYLERGGNLPDDARFICGWLRCDVRIWKKLRLRLIELNKIGIEGEHIIVPFAEGLLGDALERMAGNRRGGRNSQASQKSKRNGTSAPSSASAKPDARDTSAVASPQPSDSYATKCDSEANDYNDIAGSHLVGDLELITTTTTVTVTTDDDGDGKPATHSIVIDERTCIETAARLCVMAGVRNSPAQVPIVREWLEAGIPNEIIERTVLARREQAKSPISSLKYFDGTMRRVLAQAAYPYRDFSEVSDPFLRSMLEERRDRGEC
jgi:hypothetical protein